MRVLPLAEAPRETSVRASARLPAVDALRGVAVLAVILTHLPFSWSTSGELDLSGAGAVLPETVTRWTHYGHYGVHLFLVISGFCIHLRWARARDVSAGIEFLPFWKRRLHRLYPPYVVALVGTFAAVFVFRGVVQGGLSQGVAGAFGYPSDLVLALELVAFLLLVQNVILGPWRIGNGPLWTLALEEQLYLLYFPLLAVRRRFGWKIALPLAATVALAWQGFAVAFPHAIPRFWNAIGPARWYEWTLGAVAVEASLGLVALPRWLSAKPTLLAAFLLALATDPPAGFVAVPSWTAALRDAAFGTLFFLILHAVVLRTRAKAPNALPALRPLISIGVASYSLYLTHMPAMIVGKWLAIRAGADVAGVLCARIAFAFVVGYAFHHLVERRFLVASRTR